LSSVSTVEHRTELHETLAPVLSDVATAKVGVGLDDDALALWRATGGGLEVRGRFDISGVGAKAGQTRSLSNLTAAVLGVDLAKSKRLTLSNWARPPPLSTHQVAYAAKDAWAGAAVFQELCQRRPEAFQIDMMVDGQECTVVDLDRKSATRKKAKAEFNAYVMETKILMNSRRSEPIRDYKEHFFQFSPNAEEVAEFERRKALLRAVNDENSSNGLSFYDPAFVGM
jgi:hypothetical protein